MKMDGFDDWFEEIQSWSARYEMFQDDLESYKAGHNINMVKWLKAAYQAGYDRRTEETMDDGK